MLKITPKGETSAPAPTETLVKQVAGQQHPIGEQGSEPVKEAPASEQPDPLSPKFAMLAKREKALRSREEQIKAREAALAAKETEYQSAYIPKSKLKAETLAALNEAGVSYNELTEQLLKQPAGEIDPVIVEQRQKIAALEKRLEEIDGGMKQRQTDEYQQAVQQLKHDTRIVLKDKPEFELINGLGQHDKVVELIEATFKEEGRIMSIEDAAKDIEAYLDEEASKVISIGKVKAKFTPPTPAPEANPATKQPNPAQQQPRPTLTNAVTVSKPLTARERAILAYQGKLN